MSPKVTINSANNISLYDTNKTIYFKGNESKEWVDLDDISDYLIKSTIYTEDKNFYKHFGFDFLRIGKAILRNITSHSTNQGASTITQQYAKNLFLDFDKTWKRKKIYKCSNRSNRLSYIYIRFSEISQKYGKQ